MLLTPQDWHKRFTLQAQWTRDLRAYLFTRVRLEEARRVLEVGCGTGAILADLWGTIEESMHPTGVKTNQQIFGLDINIAYLRAAMRNYPQTGLTLGNAFSLPYPSNCFDLTLCHFLLLWVSDPLQVLFEMVRVTRPGGAVLALAEPDYGGRIDYPPELSQLGILQTQSLQKQGADPLIGRKLRCIFQQTGLRSVETGVLGGQWLGPPDWDAWESEWSVLQSDLNKTPEIINKSEVQKLKVLERSAYQLGERILFVPTFYAWGKAGSSSR
jgi:ubiquinone/menaquinone biosynthesis C-methylase UbiE